jgi:hypothetical protein
LKLTAERWKFKANRAPDPASSFGFQHELAHSPG